VRLLNSHSTIMHYYLLKQC